LVVPDEILMPSAAMNTRSERRCVEMLNFVLPENEKKQFFDSGFHPVTETLRAM